MKFVFLFACSALLASAGLIVNGSFDAGHCSTGSSCQIAAGSTALTGWQTGGQGVDWYRTGVVDLNGTLSQSIATSVGQSFLLTFDIASSGVECHLPNAQQLSVDLNGIHQTFSVASASWNSQHLLFMANAPSTTVTFSSANYKGPMLNNVSVIQTSSTPEPGTGMLLAGGLGAALFYLVKRSH